MSQDLVLYHMYSARLNLNAGLAWYPLPLLWFYLSAHRPHLYRHQRHQITPHFLAGKQSSGDTISIQAQLLTSACPLKSACPIT